MKMVGNFKWLALLPVLTVNAGDFVTDELKSLVVGQSTLEQVKDIFGDPEVVLSPQIVIFKGEYRAKRRADNGGASLITVLSPPSTSSAVSWGANLNQYRALIRFDDNAKLSQLEIQTPSVGKVTAGVGRDPTSAKLFHEYPTLPAPETYKLGHGVLGMLAGSGVVPTACFAMQDRGSDLKPLCAIDIGMRGHAMMLELNENKSKPLLELPAWRPTSHLHALDDSRQLIFGLDAALSSSTQLNIIQDGKLIPLETSLAKSSSALDMALSADKQHVVVSYENGLVKKLSLPSGELEWEAQVGKKHLVATAYSQNGRWVAVASKQVVYLLDAMNGNVLDTFGPAHSVAFINNDTQLARLTAGVTTLHRLTEVNGKIKIANAHDAIITAPFVEDGPGVDFDWESCKRLRTDATTRWLAVCDGGLTLYDSAQQSTVALTGTCPPQSVTFDNRGGLWVSTAWSKHDDAKREKNCGVHHIGLALFDTSKSTTDVIAESNLLDGSVKINQTAASVESPIKQ